MTASRSFEMCFGRREDSPPRRSCSLGLSARRAWPLPTHVLLGVDRRRAPLRCVTCPARSSPPERNYNRRDGLPHPRNWRYLSYKEPRSSQYFGAAWGDGSTTRAGRRRCVRDRMTGDMEANGTGTLRASLVGPRRQSEPRTDVFAHRPRTRSTSRRGISIPDPPPLGGRVESRIAHLSGGGDERLQGCCALGGRR